MSENSPSFSVDAHLIGEPTRRNRTPSQTRSGVSISSPPPSLIFFVWSKVSPIFWKLFLIYVKIFIFVASLGIFVLTTVFLYSLVYWMVIPKRLHSYPVYFDYAGNDVCSTTVFSTERQWETASRPIHNWDMPTGGYDFDVMLTLDFPVNSHNKQLGPVMFETRVFSSHSEIVKTKRPFFIPHISWLAHLFRDTVYMALAGLYLVTDKLSAEILLIESLPVFSHEPLSQVSVCMHAPGIHVYSGQIHFVSKLSGISYLVAHHPIFVGLVVVGIVVAIAVLGIVAAAVFRYIKSKDDIQWVEEDLSPVSRPSSGIEEVIPGRSSSSNSNLRKRG